jgi:hypothetical protein
LVTPGFALAPIITCVPDIIISDVEDNSQTNDLNFFVFHDALDLDDLVEDADQLSSEIRWSFLEPAQTLEINGLQSDPLLNPIEPGTNDLRLVSRYATFENVAWSGGVAGTDDSTQTVVTLIASDGSASDSVDIIVTTVSDNTTSYTDGPGDSLSIPAGVQYTWTTAGGDWAFYGFTGVQQPNESVNNALVITQTTAMTDPLVYGAWESTKDPALALQAKRGCVMRARYQLTSPDGQVCPGFRMRGTWYKVVYNTQYAQWVLDFTDQDFNAEQHLIYATFDGRHIAGREPGTSGQTYTLLYYPEQTDTLESTGVVYLAFELLDNDVFAGANDNGALACSQIDVDHFDNPAIRSGRVDYETTDFAGWVDGITKIYDTVNTSGLSITHGAGGIVITVQSTNRDFEAVSHSPDIVLDSGRYYRATYMVTSSQTPGGPFGPTVRGSVASSTFIFSNQKDLLGGGLMSAFDSTPRPYHVWFQAPSPETGTQTEPMWMVFESFLTSNPSAFFPTKTIQGTVTCTEAVLESWPEMP